MKTNTEPRSTTHPRILFFSPETTLRGASIQLLHLIKAMNEQGWEAIFAAPEPGPIADLLKNAGTRIEIDGTFLVDPNHEKLRALCRQFDVVVANSVTAWPAVDAAYQENVPVIWHQHETLAAARFIKEIPPARNALNRASVIVVPSERAAHVLEPLTRTRIEVMPYGIPDVPTVKPNVVERKVSFVALARFEPHHGQELLMEAIRQLDPEMQKETVFKIAGEIIDRKFFSDLEERAAGLKNVELIESPDPKEAARLLVQADAVICASRDETIPLTILEAARLSKAIVSTDVGGLSEWIRDGLNGLLVPPGNSSALSVAITRLAQDRQLQARLGETARRTFERHFRFDRFILRFAELLERFAQEKRILPPRRDYGRWIEEYDTLTPSDRVRMRRRLRALPRQAFISVILPVFNPDLDVLSAAVDSVRQQLYDNWELCIADDASTSVHVRPFLEQLAAEEPRVKLTFREKNGHISACSNSALALATGEWCALLDHDDLLAESALALVAMEIVEYPNAGMIYSDQDSISRNGVRSNPFFKSDWDPVLFLGQNFVNHLGVYKTSLLREVGGFREGYEGSQDYDLVLRCVERLRPDQVRHIPRILYHWRMIPGSVGASAEEKPYAKEAARRAIADHLVRAGIAGRVEPCPENINHHRVILEVPKPEPTVSIIIPMRDHVGLLKKCVRSLREGTDYPRTEIIIVDNNSVEDETHEYLRELKTGKIARVLKEHGPFNFSRLINCGAAAAKGTVLALLNNDIEAEERGWLREMVSHAVRPEVGAVGARLWYPDDRMQHGGVTLGFGGVAGNSFSHLPRGHPGYWNRAFLARNCSALTAACLVMRRAVFMDVGGFNQVDLAVNFNDVEFCLHLRARGLQIIWTPYANLTHRESASRGYRRTVADQTQFFREIGYMQQRWGAELLCDPFYSPNLSLQFPGFQLAFPPRWKTCGGTASIAA